METSGPRSNTIIWASSDSRRDRAAADAPPATPPTISSFTIETLFRLKQGSARGAGLGDLIALVPRHSCQDHSHATSVGDACKDQPSPDERRQGDKCRMDKPGERRPSEDEQA